ncbi:hypothetical protein FSP39_005301 [Pinctada imbricata]|uniref:Uncharacterized protein n=1 Tax=Pinctada imbricata TaxID=66713 RepID=A0AA88XL61_PINIB|nr:hypothetical protein FSP39_005301 [Pinctada imbricata]
MTSTEERNVVQLKGDPEYESEDEKDTECGIGSFRPNFLQAFANVNAFVGAYSFIGLISQTLSVYVNSQVPALEKQFGLNSAESGLVMSFNDIGFFTTVLFAASVVRFVHIPRFIYFCMLLYGLSGVLCSIPHFIAQGQGLLDNFYIESTTSVISNNTISKETKSDLLCDNTRILKNITDEMNCAADSDSKFAQLISPSISIKKTALGLIGIGMVLQGIGKSPRIAAFTLYVDDNVDRRKTGFYGGIAAMFLYSDQHYRMDLEGFSVVCTSRWKMYSNCTCIPDGTATAGFCKTDCPMIYPWAIVNFLSSVAGAMKIMPNHIIMIRCVRDTDKATAIGLSAFLVSSLGWALSPITLRQNSGHNLSDLAIILRRLRRMRVL